MKTLGQQIRALREGKKISLREMCRRSGDISPAFLSDIELGRRHPSDEVLKDIARVLSVPFDGLKALDSRPAIEEIRNRAKQDPRWAYAFRRVIDEQITPDEIVEFVRRKAQVKK